MNVAKYMRVCGEQSDETFFLLSTSLNSLSSSPVISVSLSSEIHIGIADNHAQQQFQQSHKQYKNYTNDTSITQYNKQYSVSDNYHYDDNIESHKCSHLLL